jgi:hypothetical protein
MKKLHYIALAIFLLTILSSCTNYSTSLNEKRLKSEGMSNVKKGEACSKNLFGGFTLPYFGDTAIRLSGDESVMAAIKTAKITHVYAVDKKVRNYILYSNRCTIVFGN